MSDRLVLAILAFSIVFIQSCKVEDPLFVELDAKYTGIDFINEIIEQDSFNILHEEYMYNGGGVGVADLNNDGLQDLIFTGNKVQSRIYLNRGDLQFQDISNHFESLTNDRWISGVSVIDINADGWIDLYFTATFDENPERRQNQLWINQGLKDGVPHFQETAMSYGIADTGYSVHATFLDYDLDGDLDLYVLNNIVDKQIPTNYRDKIVDGTARNNDQFYRNNGDGSFSNITLEAGIVYEGYGLGLGVGDFNKDHYPDLYISNDYIANDLLYLNQKDGTYRNASESYLSYHSRFSMGNDVSDVNNDGYVDVLTLDMLPELYARKKQTINGNSYLIYKHNERYGYQNQYVRNMLHLNNGTANGELLQFSEIGQMAGVYQTEWSWSALFADYDNDGDRDLTITNGFPKDLTDKDFTNYKAELYGYLIGDKELLPKIPIVKVPNYAFENIGDLQFVDRTREWGLYEPSFSNGAAFADLDNDGDLDYVVNNINAKASIYRNSSQQHSPGNYLRIELQGAGANPMAIGSKVELWADGHYQYYEHYLTRGYISSVDPVIHFGLGKVDIIDSIVVIWPGGEKRTLAKNMPPNQKVILDVAEASPFELNDRVPTVRQAIFEASQEVEYFHYQEDYFDFFQSQRIIPHKFSQVGPCMAKGDLNGDGKDDLFIGGSAGTPAHTFLFDGQSFTMAHLEGLTDQKECLESDIVIFDVDNDGDNDVVALAGGYAHDQDQDYIHYIYLNEGGHFVKKPLPLEPFIASVVRVEDFDKDGDPDLFIGSRVKRDHYPLSKSSYILENDGSGFNQSGVWSFDLGMVTDAAWSDLDGDGWLDIVITREWNAPVVLRNKGGENFEIDLPEGVKEYHGFWSAVAAADLDGDGDDDYVLGNLGENHRFNVSPQYPLRIYGVDLDTNGIIDPLSTGYWKDEKGVMQEYPIHYLDELAAQSPFFRKKFTSYAQFSRTSVDSIVNRSAITDSSIFYVNTTSSYICWNDNGRLVPQKLPRMVQSSVVREVLVIDFNEDGNQDLLVLGNDHTYDVSTGDYDANKGTLLLNQGDRVFKIISPRESGLYVKGQVESVLYFEGQPSVLVVGINRDSVFTFIQKPNLKPPL